jgi:hypothetical protein
VTVAGRLLREGQEDAPMRQSARALFARAFSHLAADLDRTFDRWFLDPAPSHAAIADFARNPRAAELAGAERA